MHHDLSLLHYCSVHPLGHSTLLRAVWHSLLVHNTVTLENSVQCHIHKFGVVVVAYTSNVLSPLVLVMVLYYSNHPSTFFLLDEVSHNAYFD